MTRRILIALALLLAVPAAHADPFTIIAAIATAVGAPLWVQIAIVIAANVVGSASKRRKQRKEAARQRAEHNASLTDQGFTGLQALPPHRVVYGRRVVGGDIVAMFTSDKTGRREDGTTYTKPDALQHLVIEICHHQSSAIHEVFIEGDAVGALDVNGWAAGAPFATTRSDSRSVSVPASGFLDVPEAVVSILNAYYYDAISTSANVDVTPTLSMGNTRITNPAAFDITVDYKITASIPSVRVGVHLGSSTQTVDTYLNSIRPTEWTADHRLRGATYAVVTLDLEDHRFQSGPPNITFDVSGRVDVLDPRTGLTAWTSNPALIIRDWLMAPWGYGCASSDIDEAFCIATANACDVAISLTVGATTTPGQATYTCNAAFDTDESREKVLEDLCESMAGFASYGAQWQIVAGSWTPPVTFADGSTVLDDDDLHGMIEVVQAGASMGDLFNGVRGTYIPVGKTVPLDFKPPYQNTTFVAADGEELWSDVEFRFVDNPARCRNLARVFTERARSSLVIRYPAKLKAWPLQVGDRLRVTNTEYGFTEKYFRVTDWQFGVNAPVLLLLQEDDPSIYDLADAATADPTPNSDLPDPWTVGAIAGLAALSVGEGYVAGDGTYVPRVRVTWTAVADPYVVDGTGRLELLWRRPGSTSWQQQNLPGDATKAYIDGVKDDDRLVIEIRAVNGLGKVGGSSFLAHTVSGKTAAPAAVTGLAAAVVQSGVFVSWTASPEDDNAYTEIRHGAVSWATATTIFKGKASNFVWPSPTPGSYTLRAKHFDRAGNESATNTTTSISFTANDLRDAAAVNFDARNDRIGTAVVTPTVAADGTAVDHAVKTDGSADISFEWSWSGTESEIDGFEVLAYAATSSAAYTIGSDPSGETVTTMPANKRAFLVLGVNPTSYFTFAVRAYRVVDPDVDVSGIMRSAWVKPSIGAEDPYRPAANAAFAGDVTGTVASVAAATVGTAATNYNARNDRIATAVVAPTVAADGTAVDHTINPNGSADVSFEWVWGGTEAEIDGFQVMARISTSSSAYTVGTTPAEEMVLTMPANKRAQFLFSVNPTSYITFAVRAYRVVDPDVNATGMLYSAWVQPSIGGEHPYRPASSVAFAGDVTGTVAGIAAANVNVWTAITGINVTTGQIDANAATETYMGTDAGPYTTVASNKAPVTFTPDVTCDVLVTVEGDFSCSNPGGAAAFMKGRFAIYKDLTTTYASRPIAQTIGAGLSIEYPISATYRFNAVPAGVAVTFGCYYSDHVSSALTGTISELRTKVEEIKR